jgi:hypothetical protein
VRIVPLEDDVQAAIIEAFRFKYRITLFPIDAGCAGMRSGASRKGHSTIPGGFPDLMGIIPNSGRGLFIECKKKGKKPRKNQESFLEFFRSQRAVALWADSVDSAIKQFEENSV